MFSWITTKHSNDEGISWKESRHIQDGLRCSRIARSYYDITYGTTWETRDSGKIAKLEFKRGPTVDVRIKQSSRATVEQVLAFAFQCLRDDAGSLDPVEPIRAFYPKELKHMICCIRYYESTHPKFGHLFQGEAPTVSIGNLAEMVIDAFQSRTVRLIPNALRFDPKD